MSDLRSAVGLATLFAIVIVGAAGFTGLCALAAYAQGLMLFGYCAALFLWAVLVIFAGTRVVEWGTRP